MSTTIKNETIVAEVLTEFLEVATHSILHARKIYPETIFVKCKKYGISVHKSIHPKLNEYITGCIKTAIYLIRGNRLNKFVICFMNKTNVPQEKYVFDVITIRNALENDPYLIKLEQNLRTFCLTIHSSIGYLKALSAETNFVIFIHTTEQANLDCMENALFENFPWIQVDPANVLDNKSDIIPVHTTDFDFLKLQIYIKTVV